jgi:hypothetical protein
LLFCFSDGLRPNFIDGRAYATCAVAKSLQLLRTTTREEIMTDIEWPSVADSAD